MFYSERTNLLNQMFHGYRNAPFAVRTLDGWRWRSSETREPECTIVLKTPGALRTLLNDPSELALAEEFIDDHLEVEGDIFAVFPVAQHLFSLPRSLEGRVATAMKHYVSDIVRYSKRGPLHSVARDQAAIAQHYDDQPAEFYRPWLGESLAYSCAYFRSPDESLDAAQENKFELICRKLRLSSTDRFLDVGCGWGSLILHAAQLHGAEARGITLSRSQAAVAARRITDAGIARRCAVEFRDYRDATSIGDPFDKIASVGMFEHVGLANLRRYFAIIFDLLKPGGLFLNHGIARSACSPLRKDSFMDAHVFPDGQLVPVSQAMQLAESVGFEICDVENLREHYARTLRLWVKGLQQNSESVLAKSSKKRYRTWLLYMAGCAFGFDCGDIAIYQILFRRRKDGQCSLPMTRECFYQDWPREEGRLVA